MDYPPNDMRVSTELVFPETVRNQDRVVLEVREFARLVQAPEVRMNSEDFEKSLRGRSAIHQLRLAVACPSESETRDEFGDSNKRSVLIAVIDEIWSGSEDPRRSAAVGS